MLDVRSVTIGVVDTEDLHRLIRRGDGIETRLPRRTRGEHALRIDRLARERDAAKVMVKQLPRTTRRITLGGDKGYDTENFVKELRRLKVTPHVAQNNSNRKSAIDGRTTNHPNYAVSQRTRKRIEEGFGWMKTIGRLRKTMYRGIEKIAMQLDLHAAAYNLVRMKNLGLGVT